jgi:hypothetical protein
MAGFQQEMASLESRELNRIIEIYDRIESREKRQKKAEFDIFSADFVKRDDRLLIPHFQDRVPIMYHVHILMYSAALVGRLR